MPKKKKEKLVYFIIIVVVVLLCILIFSAEFYMFKHWDCNDEFKEKCVLNSSDYIFKKDCSHLVKDVWLCNTRKINTETENG